MDIELLKSGAEDQMEMMLMMQMDKLSHEFSTGSYSDGSEMPMMDFSAQAAAAAGSNNNNTAAAAMAAQVVMSNNSSHAASSSAFMNLPSTTISFTTSPHGHHHDQDQDQDPSSCAAAVLPLFLSNSTSVAAKWMMRNGTDQLGAATTFGSSPSSSSSTSSSHLQKQHNSVAAMREMIFRIAAMQPIHIDPESVKPPKRRNVKISKDPQSVAARHRRERISERIRILQRLVPGGTKMDTASMLDEAIHYVKFLKNQVQSLERAAATRGAAAAAPPPSSSSSGMGFPIPMSSGTYLPMSTSATKGYHAQNVQHYADA